MEKVFYVSIVWQEIQFYNDQISFEKRHRILKAYAFSEHEALWYALHRFCRENQWFDITMYAVTEHRDEDKELCCEYSCLALSWYGFDTKEKWTVSTEGESG